MEESNVLTEDEKKQFDEQPDLLKRWQRKRILLSIPLFLLLNVSGIFFLQRVENAKEMFLWILLVFGGALFILWWIHKLFSTGPLFLTCPKCKKPSIDISSDKVVDLLKKTETLFCPNCKVRLRDDGSEKG